MKSEVVSEEAVRREVGEQTASRSLQGRGNKANITFNFNCLTRSQFSNHLVAELCPTVSVLAAWMTAWRAATHHGIFRQNTE